MALENTAQERIREIREKQDRYFRSGATLELKTRKQHLKEFKAAVLKWEQPRDVAFWKYRQKTYADSYVM